MMKLIRILTILAAAAQIPGWASADSGFSEAELEVARFWEQMGPTLANEGIEAYARRYHEDFSFWDIQNSGRMGGKDSAIQYWTKFHEAGHRITCTHVVPVQISLFGDFASARLIYEQTDALADGSVRTGIWRMVALFERVDASWQVLATNMVDFDPGRENGNNEGHRPHCP